MALRQRKSKTAATGEAVVPVEEKSPPPHSLTLIEGQAFFDNMTRQLLTIGGEEFVRRYHAGRYDDILDDPHYSDLMYRAMLGGLGNKTEESKGALRRKQIDDHSAEPEADDSEDPTLPAMRLLTISESWAFFDDMARQLLAISGDEFIRRYQTGRYDDILDDPHHSDLIYLAMLGGLGH